MKFILFLLFCCPSFFAQQDSYNTCKGAINAPVESSFSLPFLAKKTSNDIWVFFNAPHDGWLNLMLTCENLGPTEITALYYISENGVCDTNMVESGAAFSMLKNKNLDFQLTQNQTLIIHLIAPKKFKEAVIFKSGFTKINQKETLVDLKYSNEVPAYTLYIRDKTSNEPVVGKVYLQGSNDIAGTYFASHLQININQKIRKGSVKIEAPGYFPLEISEQGIPINENFIDTFYLQKFEVGTLSKLEKVYFNAGLAQITEDSYPQLNRLRDLLVLNPNIAIEIHGHVNLDENSDKKAQKLSKQRALMVKNYLIKSGVDAKRLIALGFGGTKPIYAQPQNESQKEANRRVEILIRNY